MSLAEGNPASQPSPAIGSPEQKKINSGPHPAAAPAIPKQEGPKANSLQGQSPEQAAPKEPESRKAGNGRAEDENFITGRLPYEVSTSVGRFGYDLFNNPPSTFAPVDVIPVGPDYIIGPEDELWVSLWGQVNETSRFAVDREGRITIPQRGPVFLSGMTFKDAQKKIEDEYSNLYRPSEVKVGVSMGRLRTIRIFVVGKVERPGSYTLSSLSTLINALFVSGGPSLIGSMRDIQLKRDGKTIVHFDLYEFLLNGDKTKDVRLMPEDVIFVPPVGPLAMIAGEVKAPGIYEMKGETRIRDAIAMAGGLNATGYLQRVQVSRIYDNEVRTILDANLKDVAGSQDILLTDGSAVKVYPISNAVVNAVNLTGNVVRPGQYQWTPGMKVSDLFKEPEKDLMPETFYAHALIERYVPPDNHKEIVAFDLGKALFEKDGGEDRPLRPYDTLTVYSKWDFAERPAVRVSGAVNRPAAYEFLPGMKISDLLKLAGGMLYYASYQAELTRVEATQDGPLVQRVTLDLKRAMEGDPQSDIPLKMNDFLVVRTVPDWSLYRVVKVSGEVMYPGDYTIQKGESLSSLIKRAGGFTPKAYLKGSVFRRESIRAAQQKNLDEIISRLEQEILFKGPIPDALDERARQKEKAAEERKQAFLARVKSAKSQGRIAIRILPLQEFAGSPGDVELEEGDSLFIPQEPGSVQVTGSVYNQTAFIYQPGGTVGSYISMAGGMTRDADEGEIFLLKADGTAVSKSGNGFFEYGSDTHSWLGGFMSRRLDPGDTIVVPMCFEKVDWIAEVKDITTILFQVAVAAGVVIAAF